MAWKDGFVIEYVGSKDSPKCVRISCKKCVHYRDDESCFAHAVLISAIGFDSWKNCSQFKLSKCFDDEKHRDLVSSVKSERKNKKRKKKKYVCDPYVLQRLERGRKVYVKHAKRGIGRVLSVDRTYLHVRFANQTTRFAKYPFKSLYDGTLQITDIKGNVIDGLQIE